MTLPLNSSNTPRAPLAGNESRTLPVAWSSLNTLPVVNAAHQTLPSDASAIWWAKEIEAVLWNVPTDVPVTVKRCTSSLAEDDATSTSPWNDSTENGDGARPVVEKPNTKLPAGSKTWTTGPGAPFCVPLLVT